MAHTDLIANLGRISGEVLIKLAAIRANIERMQTAAFAQLVAQQTGLPECRAIQTPQGTMYVLAITAATSHIVVASWSSMGNTLETLPGVRLRRVTDEELVQASLGTFAWMEQPLPK